MAIKNAHVSVGTTATVLASSPDDGTQDQVAGVSALIANAGSATIYLGDANVTTSNGFALAAGAVVSVGLEHGESIYGVVASSTVTAHVLRGGVG